MLIILLNFYLISLDLECFIKGKKPLKHLSEHLRFSTILRNKLFLNRFILKMIYLNVVKL